MMRVLNAEDVVRTKIDVAASLSAVYARLEKLLPLIPEHAAAIQQAMVNIKSTYTAVEQQIPQPAKPMWEQKVQSSY